MGIFDSSQTRVTPVFNRLYTRDCTGENWISQLLELPEFGASPKDHKTVLRLENQKFGQSFAWGEREMALDAPIELLRWLVQNLSTCAEPATGDDETARKRKSLQANDPSVISEALALIDNGTKSGWHILEGKSRPDVFLQTEEAIIVIEGKRTESGPTTDTTWLTGRHQMLRHMDCAWEMRQNRAVYGFFIVEGEDESDAVPNKWVQFSKDTVDESTLKTSLPHRDDAIRQQISDGFLGVTTWRKLCRQFDISWSSLPERTH